MVDGKRFLLAFKIFPTERQKIMKCKRKFKLKIVNFIISVKKRNQ